MPVGPWWRASGRPTSPGNAAPDGPVEGVETPTAQPQDVLTHALTQHSREGAILAAADGLIQYASPSATRILGYETTSLAGRSVLDLLHPADRDGYMDLLYQVAQEPGVSRTAEGRFRRQDGSWRWLETTLVNLPAERTAEAVALTFHDVTERKQAELALREREEQYRSLVTNVPGAVYRCVFDADWTMGFVSDYIREITGYPASDFIGSAVRPFGSVMHPEDREGVKTGVQQAVERGEPFALEYRVLRADGAAQWVHQRGRGVLAGDGERWWLDGVLFDVTERRDLEGEQEERARLDGAILVARTVAHEINNALAPVTGFAELLSLRPEIMRDPSAAAFVKSISDAAEQAAEKVRRLQRIIRLQEVVSPLGPDKSVLDLDRSSTLPPKPGAQPGT